MSLLSKLLQKIVPAPVLKLPVLEFGAAEINGYLDVAKTGGREALEHAVTIPMSELAKIAPHADPARLQAADAALARAEADLILIVAGVDG